jgi:predicted RNase H-like nuclease (RuvC/YqgF family)
MSKIRCRLVVIAIAAALGGCATTEVTPDAPDNAAPVVEATLSRSPADIQRIAELERQLLREQRQYQAEKRRLDLSLKESQKLNEELQKKLDDLQKKLDALLAIDRDLRSRNRGR